MAAHATRRQWETSAAMIAIYQSAAAVDKEAAPEMKASRDGRRTNLKRFIDGMAAMLRPELDVAQASAIFLSMTLAEIYGELVNEAGWSPDEYEAWLAAALKDQLLP
jgi:hypothetical protein